MNNEKLSYRGKFTIHASKSLYVMTERSKIQRQIRLFCIQQASFSIHHSPFAIRFVCSIINSRSKTQTHMSTPRIHRLVLHECLLPFNKTQTLAASYLSIERCCCCATALLLNYGAIKLLNSRLRCISDNCYLRKVVACPFNQRIQQEFLKVRTFFDLALQGTYIKDEL